MIFFSAFKSVTSLIYALLILFIRTEEALLTLPTLPLHLRASFKLFASTNISLSNTKSRSTSVEVDQTTKKVCVLWRILVWHLACLLKSTAPRHTWPPSSEWLSARAQNPRQIRTLAILSCRRSSSIAAVTVTKPMALMFTQRDWAHLASKSTWRLFPNPPATCHSNPCSPSQPSPSCSVTSRVPFKACWTLIFAVAAQNLA